MAEIRRGSRNTASFFITRHRKMIDKNVISELAEAYLKDTPDYLVDVLMAPGNVITVEIDNDNGVNIDECVALSRYIEDNLDRDTEDFELTVTSAGLTSPFKTRRQYKKFEGKEIEVLSKKGKKLKGTLKTSTDANFTITTTKMVKPEGAKRKQQVEEDTVFAYDEVKYTKYLIKI